MDEREQIEIPDHGITDAEMWANVDNYLLTQKALKLITECVPGVFFTNRKKLALANAFANDRLTTAEAATGRRVAGQLQKIYDNCGDLNRISTLGREIDRLIDSLIVRRV